jgi:hypothetical protein
MSNLREHKLDAESLALMVARGDGMTMRERMRAAELIRASGPESEGWKLVPVEPTQEMIDAGAETIHRKLDEGKQASTVYRHMLRAAPSSSGPESEAEAACAAMVKWCDKNDWGSVPKKLEERLRNACRATKEKG